MLIVPSFIGLPSVSNFCSASFVARQPTSLQQSSTVFSISIKLPDNFTVTWIVNSLPLRAIISAIRFLWGESEKG